MEEDRHDRDWHRLLRAALALADRHDGVYAVLGIDPHQASSAEADRIDELRELLGHPNAVGVGETGLDNFREHATPADQKRLFDAQLELAGALDLPVVIHSREADEDTAAALAGFEGDGCPPLLLLARAPERRPRTGLLRLVRRQRDLSEGGRPSRGGARGARRPTSRGDGQPVPEPAAGARTLNEPANLVHTVAALADVRGVDASTLAAQTHENASRAFRLP